MHIHGGCTVRDIIVYMALPHQSFAIEGCMDAEGIVNLLGDSILTTWLPSDPCSTVLIGEEQPYKCIHYTVGQRMHSLVQ